MAMTWAKRWPRLSRRSKVFHPRRRVYFRHEIVTMSELHGGIRCVSNHASRVRAFVKLALVTETFPPEINGVAMTLHRLVNALAARGHVIEVVRPRQSRADALATPPPFAEFLVPGYPCPGYPDLKIGWPVYFRLKKHWRAARPDVVHVATEGPLGCAALHAARTLKIPVSSSFHTNFHAYGKHYGVGFLHNAGLAYFRWFHNRAACTFAPSADVITALAASGFRNLHLMGRGVDTELFPGPPRRNLARPMGCRVGDPGGALCGPSRRRKKSAAGGEIVDRLARGFAGFARGGRRRRAVARRLYARASGN